MNLAQVAAAVGARFESNPPSDVDDASTAVTSVEFDTRKVRPGSLFLALKGERVDGHDFAAAAADAGAVAVLGSRSIEAAIPLLELPAADVLEAVANLARVSVRELTAQGRLTTIGITGSAGKTSTKDLVAAITAAVGSTVAPPESFNNELGHPYTVLRADEDTRFLVLELSARGPGHIASLAEVAPLQIGVVLNVGTAHLGEFGSVEGIAKAKGELVESLAADGVAILNADDGRVAAMVNRTKARVVTFGTNPRADVRAEEIVEDAWARAGFTLVTTAGSARVQLAVAGAHQVGNALAAAAVGMEIGLSVDEIARILGESEAASKWRMAISERPDGVTIINDAYNANPDSMKAALKSLATIGQGKRTWAVLGEMAELGAAAQSAHDEIGRLVVRLGVDHLIAVGPAVRGLHLGAHLEGSWSGESQHVPDWETAVAILNEQLTPGDVVLVKASRSAGLERVALALQAEPTVSDPAQAEPTVSAPAQAEPTVSAPARADPTVGDENGTVT